MQFLVLSCSIIKLTPRKSLSYQEGPTAATPAAQQTLCKKALVKSPRASFQQLHQQKNTLQPTKQVTTASRPTRQTHVCVPSQPPAACQANRLDLLFTAAPTQTSHTTETQRLLQAVTSSAALICLLRLNMCATASSGVPTRTPCPRFKMWPRPPAFCNTSRTAASMAASPQNSTVGSTLPCRHQHTVVETQHATGTQLYGSRTMEAKQAEGSFTSQRRLRFLCRQRRTRCCCCHQIRHTEHLCSHMSF